ncbi:MAG: hypothetical protein EAX96_20515, partial [Candidatus Lokiarchaeota archaeon]|nr:hypothetical protein [Candidatus Lokiarchaeota archaeon]
MNKEKQNKIIAIVGLVLSIGALTLGFVFVFIGYFTWTPLDFNIFLIGLIMCFSSFVIAGILLVQWKELEISKFFIAFVIIIVACI